MSALYIFQEPFPIVFLSKSGESAGFSYFVGGWQRNVPHYYSVKNRNGPGIHTLVKLFQDLRSCYDRGGGRGFTRSAPGLSVMLFQGPTTACPTQIPQAINKIEKGFRTAQGAGIRPDNAGLTRQIGPHPDSRNGTPGGNAPFDIIISPPGAGHPHTPTKGPRHSRTRAAKRD